MVAVRADYRVKSRHGVTPKECVEDAKSAVRWIHQNAATLGVDPSRIVAAGGSAGGHIAACTALAPGLDAPDEDLSISSKPNALVLFNPVLRFQPGQDVRPRFAERVPLQLGQRCRQPPAARLSLTEAPAVPPFGNSDESNPSSTVARSFLGVNRCFSRGKWEIAACGVDRMVPHIWCSLDRLRM